VLSRVRHIYTEVNFREFRHGGCQYDELYSFLTTQGYERVFADSTEGWGTWQSNVLFRRREQP